MDDPGELKKGEAAPKRRRRGRYLLHASHISFALLSACLLLYLLALPVVVKQVVTSALAELGYPGATFRVRQATLWAVELADIRVAGGDQVVIHSAMARFSPVQVFGGKLQTIELTDAEVPLIIHNGVVRFTLAPKEHSKQAKAAAKGKQLPFDRLDVIASTLNVDWEGEQIKLPLQGTLTPLADSRAKIELTTFYQGTTIPVSGSVDSSGEAADLTASMTNLSVAGVRSAVPWALMAYPFQTSGRVNLRATYERSKGKSALRLHVEPKNIWVAAQPGGHQIAVQGVDGALDAELGAGFRSATLAGTLRVGRVVWDDTATEKLEFALRSLDGGAVQVEGRLRSSGWRMDSLKATANGLLASSGPIKISADFAAKGGLPPQVVRSLARDGMVIDDLGEIAVGGNGVFTLQRQATDGQKSWEVLVPRVNISLNPGLIILQNQGVSLAGVSGELKLSGSASPEGVSTTVAMGSHVTMATLESRSAWTSKRDDPRSALLAAEVVDGPVAIACQADGKGMAVKWPHVRISLAKNELTNASSQTNLHGVEGVLNLAGEFSSREKKMIVLPESVFNLQSAQNGSGESQAMVGKLRAMVLPAQAPLLDGSGGGKLAACVRLTPIMASAGKAKLGVRSTEATITVDLSAGPSVAADVSLRGGHVAQGSWSIGNVAAEVPVAWNRPAPKTSGSFSIGTASIGKCELPAVKGTLGVTNRTVALTAATEIMPGATVQADANVEWTPTGLHGRVATTMPAFKLADEKTLGEMWKPAEEMGVTGTISASGEVLFDGSLVKPRLTATMKDAKVTSQKYDLAIEGASGSVTIDSFSPISGPGLQRLRVDKFHLGKLDLSKGGVEFRVERPDSLHIERSRWSWVGGQVYTYDLRLDPAKPETLNAVIYADRLDLKQLLGALAQGQASGEGQLYGRLPIKVNWPDISFGEGFLYATGSGGIQIGKKADAVAQILDSADPRFASDPTFAQVKERMIDALKNFNYDTLKVDFIQKESGLTAAITVNGKGKTGPKPQELYLTVNVNGVDELLSEWLVIRKALGSFGQ